MSKLIGWEKEIKRGCILSIQMNLLNKCTSKCKSCRKYTWPDDELDLETVKRTLTVLKKEFGLQSVVFSGGDPILYKDFPQVIDFCNEIDLKYSLITTLISNNMQLLEKIAKTAYRIHVSVDSLDEEKYHKIRGVNALNVVKHNIEFVQSFREEMIPIRISMTVSNMNYDEVYQMYMFAGMHKLNLNYYMLHTWDELKANEQQIEKMMNKLQIVAESEQHNKCRITNAAGILASRFDFSKESDKCKRCYLPYINATINANGDIYPCCKLIDDNGCYGDQLKYVYGNVVGRDYVQIMQEFNKRWDCKYPTDGLCRECADRYNGLLADLEKIMEDSKEPIFF